jgi:hypothetical protein
MWNWDEKDRDEKELPGNPNKVNACSTRGRIGGFPASGTRFFPSAPSTFFDLPVSSPPQYERNEYFAQRS